MNELIQQLISQVGINKDQAEGGLGAILSFAKEQMNSETFSQMATNMDGAEDLISKFSNLGNEDAGGFNVGGLLNSATSALGVNADLGGMTSLIGNLSSLNLDLDTLKKFTPIIAKFLEARGHGDIAEKIKSFL